LTNKTLNFETNFVAILLSELRYDRHTDIYIVFFFLINKTLSSLLNKYYLSSSVSRLFGITVTSEILTEET